METLVLVAFTRVLVTAAVSINCCADKILVTFTCWNIGYFALWALVWWACCAVLGGTTCINLVSSDFISTFLALRNNTLLLRAFYNT
jgi:hypothetical protein